MNNPIIGKIDPCPIGLLAGERHVAQVVKQRNGKTYWRCACGTIQCLMPIGQKAIASAMQSLDLEERDQAAKEVAGEAEVEQREAALDAARKTPRKRSWLADFFDEVKKEFD